LNINNQGTRSICTIILNPTATTKEAIVSKGPTVKIIDSPIPVPNADQVVTKVIFSGSNPKDWKLPEWMGMEANQGDDIAGIVHAVGANVTEFKPGDRVAAFHEMTKLGGSYAEYTLRTFSLETPLPPSISPSLLPQKEKKSSGSLPTPSPTSHPTTNPPSPKAGPTQHSTSRPPPPSPPAPPSPSRP